MGLLSAALGVLDAAGEYVRARIGVPFVIQFGPGFTLTAVQNGGVDVITVSPNTAAGGGLTDVIGTAPVSVDTPSAGVRRVAVPAATSSVAGLMPYADKRFLDLLHQEIGTNVPNSDTVINIGGGTFRRIVVGSLTGSHFTEISTTGALAGDLLMATRLDTSIYNYTLANEGGGELFTFPSYTPGFCLFKVSGGAWKLIAMGLGEAVAGPTAPPRFRVTVGANYVPRANETILLDNGDGSVLLPIVPAGVGTQPTFVATVLGNGTGGTVTAQAGNTILGAGSDTVGGGILKQYHAVAGQAKWAVIAGTW
jgi:hypothetical protein